MPAKPAAKKPAAAAPGPAMEPKKPAAKPAAAPGPAMEPKKPAAKPAAAPGPAAAKPAITGRHLLAARESGKLTL